MKVKFLSMHERAVLPDYAKEGDAGLDLTAVGVSEKNEYYQVHFGVAVEIPAGYFGLLVPRSGITDTNMMLKNSVGIIDPTYRGELRARFKKVKFEDGTEAQVYKAGERCAQLIILPYPTIVPEWAGELSPSRRNADGFGSTGN